MIEHSEYLSEIRANDKLGDLQKDVSWTRVQVMRTLIDKMELLEDNIEKFHYALKKQWGSYGQGDGQFNGAFSISVTSQSVYVSDSSNCRIQKFDKNGNFITKWGSRGRGDGQFPRSEPPGGPFVGPAGITLDSQENLYVCDYGGHRIQKFDKNGNFITKWGSRGRGDGQFFTPIEITIDRNGNLYVADDGARIQKFDKNGNFITKWGGIGSEPGRFGGIVEITGMCIDDNQILYAADSGNHRVQKFDTSGNFLSLWHFNPSIGGLTIDHNNKVYLSIRASVSGCSTDGKSISLVFNNASLQLPFGIAVYDNMNLFIVDTDTVQLWSLV